MQEIIEKALINAISAVRENNSTKFFSQDDIARLENSNVLKFSDIILVEEIDKLENISLHPLIGLDIETTGLNPREDDIVGFSLSDSVKHYYFNLLKILPGQHENDYLISLKKLQTFLARIFSQSSKILAHNAKFEISFFLEKLKISIPEQKIIDTMVIAYLLDKPMKLSTLSGNYLKRYPLGWLDLCSLAVVKEDEGDKIPVELIAPYCCEDSYECILLYRHFCDDMVKYYQNEIPEIDFLNCTSISKMELAGIQVDSEAIPKFIAYTENLKNALLDEFVNITGSESDVISSPQKLSKLLYDKLNLDTTGINKGKSGYYSVDKASLNELDGLHEVIPVIQDYQVVSRVKSFLISGKNEEKGLVNLIDFMGVLYPQTNNCITATGRLSMSKPNLQQTPSPARYKSLKNKNLATLGTKFRNLFITRSIDNYFVVADYPSFEFRILASISNDETLIKIFQDGLDFHVIICEKLFKITYDKKNSFHQTLRQVTKTINYGVAYGMSWIRLQRECLKVGLKYSRSECEKILSDYWRVIPGVYAFFCREKLRALTLGYSQTAWGRKRFYQFDNYRLKSYIQDHLSYFAVNAATTEECIYQWEVLVEKKIFNPKDESNFRTIQNNPLQGTNADVVRKVLNILTSRCEEIESSYDLFCRVVLTVHDEFLIECHKELIPIVTQLIKSVMENSIELLVPLPIEPIVCQKWGEAK
jgi:DNA polymerase I